MIRIFQLAVNMSITNYPVHNIFLLLPRYLAYLESLESMIDIPPPLNYTKTEDSVEKLCHQLDDIQIERVKKKFQHDFDMLGYDTSNCHPSN